MSGLEVQEQWAPMALVAQVEQVRLAGIFPQAVELEVITHIVWEPQGEQAG